MNAVIEAPGRVSLYYREGSSDKVYQAAIEPAGNQFVVNFAYGRRGGTPVSLGDDPEGDAIGATINREQTHPCAQSGIVLLPIFFAHFAPVACLMPLQSALEIGGCELAQSIGSDDHVAKWE